MQRDIARMAIAAIVLGGLPRTSPADPPILPVTAAMGTARPSPSSSYAARIYTSPNGNTMPYRLLLPRKYNPKKAYPLVLFLHGDGERGDDNQLQLRHGGDLFLSTARRYPAIVVFPQMPQNTRWVDVPMDNVPSMTYPAKPAEPMQLAMGIVGSLEHEFHADPKRIYVMGVSDGGFGAWDALIRYPGVFAAGVSMCGGADPAKAPALAHTPIWAFHSASDSDVYLPVEKNMVVALQRLHNRSLKYTEYTGMEHSDAFTAGLAEPKLLSWLFVQKRK